MSINGNYIKSMLLFVLLLMPNSCFGAPNDSIEVNKTKMLSELSEFGISLFIDSDIRVALKSSIEDFELYEFIFKDFRMVVYIGNHPQFPPKDIPKNVTLEKRSINDIKASSYHWDTGGNIFSGQYLFDLSTKRSFPQYVHFSYVKIPEKIMAKFESIIKSVNLTESQE